MCINIGGGQPQINSPENTNKADKKKNVENENVEVENEGVNPLDESDNVEVENKYKDSGHAATSISFEEPVSDMKNNKLSEQEMKIVEFIASINDKTMQAVLDAFDRMLESARIMREENERFYKKVTQPKQEAMKKEIMQEDMLKENIQSKINA